MCIHIPKHRIRSVNECVHTSRHADTFWIGIGNCGDGGIALQPNGQRHGFGCAGHICATAAAAAAACCFCLLL